MRSFIFSIMLITIMLASCNKSRMDVDATGTFEAREIIISSESNGIIKSFPFEEGETIEEGITLAEIETTGLEIQKAQLEATMEAVGMKTLESDPQVKILDQQKVAAQANLNTLETQLMVTQREFQRIASLASSAAATEQQLDNIKGQVEILESKIEAAKTQNDIIDTQIASAKRNVSLQNRGITSERKPLAKQMELIDHQISKSTIRSPINGTLITKFAEPNEFIAMGRPICKIADLSEMDLHAYITGPQLSEVKLGEEVEVLVDHSEGQKSYKGTISWISDQAEFTPKSIQTKDERANLVYAINIKVANDGFIKIGMYGEVNFLSESLAHE